jgi:Cytochrome c553
MKKTLLLVIAIGLMAAWNSSAADNKANWDKLCAKCHGAEGKGDTKMGQKLGAKDYSSAKVQDELKDDVAIKAIKEGVKDKDGKVLMKPTEGLSDDEVKGLVAYLRSLKK